MLRAILSMSDPGSRLSPDSASAKRSVQATRRTAARRLAGESKCPADLLVPTSLQLPSPTKLGAVESREALKLTRVKRLAFGAVGRAPNQPRANAPPTPASCSSRSCQLFFSLYHHTSRQHGECIQDIRQEDRSYRSQLCRPCKGTQQCRPDGALLLPQAYLVVPAKRRKGAHSTRHSRSL